jgi:hypothetical protein
VPRDFVPVGAEVIQRPARPCHGEPQAFLGALAIGGIFRAFVEGHGDVSAEGDLNINGMLGSKRVRTPVEVRAKAHTVFRNLAQRVEREDLESAGVGEQGARPAYEFVQAAHAANGLMAGPQVKVIGIAENDLRAEGLKHILRDGLHGSLRSDRHEDGRFDCPMRQSEAAAAPAGSGFCDELERRSHALIVPAQSLPVLLVSHVFHPVNDPAFKLFLNGDVHHGRSWRGSMPMLFAGRNPDHVAGTDLLNWAAPALHPAATVSHDEGLAERVRMPGGPRAWLEGDMGALNQRGLRRLNQRIEAHRAGEPVGRSLCGRSRACSQDLHILFSF